MWGGDASGWRCVEVEACGREGRTVANRDMVEVVEEGKSDRRRSDGDEDVPETSSGLASAAAGAPLSRSARPLGAGAAGIPRSRDGTPDPKFNWVHARICSRTANPSSRPSPIATQIHEAQRLRWPRSCGISAQVRSPTSLLYHGNSGHDQRARSKPRRRAGDTRNLRTFVVERAPRGLPLPAVAWLWSLKKLRHQPCCLAFSESDVVGTIPASNDEPRTHGRRFVKCSIGTWSAFVLFTYWLIDEKTDKCVHPAVDWSLGKPSASTSKVAALVLPHPPLEPHHQCQPCKSASGSSSSAQTATLSSECARAATARVRLPHLRVASRCSLTPARSPPGTIQLAGEFRMLFEAIFRLIRISCRWSPRVWRVVRGVRRARGARGDRDRGGAVCAALSDGDQHAYGGGKALRHHLPTRPSPARRRANRGLHLAPAW